MKFKLLKRIPGWMKGVLTGVLFLGLGAYYDQFSDIFRKAVMICLECIGIGQTLVKGIQKHCSACRSGFQAELLLLQKGKEYHYETLQAL